jgi:hypothetical protein
MLFNHSQKIPLPYLDGHHKGQLQILTLTIWFLPPVWSISGVVGRDGHDEDVGEVGGVSFVFDFGALTLPHQNKMYICHSNYVNEHFKINDLELTCCCVAPVKIWLKSRTLGSLHRKIVERDID